MCRWAAANRVLPSHIGLQSVVIGRMAKAERFNSGLGKSGIPTKKKKKKKIASLEVVKELEGLVGALVLSVLVEYLSLRVAFGTSNSKSL